MLKSFLLSFLLAFSTQLYSQENFNKSYGELAKDTVQKGLDRVLAETSLLVHSTPPLDTKKLRKEIGNLKLLLDVFSFAYPKLKKGDHKVIDPLIELRKVLDEGYEVVGKFKDLADSGSASGSLPSENEVKELRSKAINWKKKFLEHLQENSIKTYLASPLVGGFQNRETEFLHKYTWKQINLRPSLNVDGLTTTKRMCNEVLMKADSHLSSMMSFADLFELEREEFFHSVRKEMRIVLKMAEMVQGVFDTDINEGPEKKIVTLAVEKFGAVHDLLMALHRAKAKKNEVKVRELMSKLNVEFNTLKNWVNEVNLSSNLDILSRQLN